MDGSNMNYSHVSSTPVERSETRIRDISNVCIVMETNIYNIRIKDSS